MPGNFTLGCLLGQYDGAQSFDVASKTLAFGDGTAQVGSWELFPGSYDIRPNQVLGTHSSFQGLRGTPGSHDSQEVAIRYVYDFPNDFNSRRFPDVATWALRADVWGRVDLTTASGTLRWLLHDGLVNQQVYLPPLGTMLNSNIRLHGLSNSLCHFEIRKEISQMSGAEFRIDDVLMQTDWINIFPDYSMIDQEKTIKRQTRTMGGDLHTYVWDKYFAWSMPLMMLSTSHADQINFWWENQFNLNLTLDTSDAESQYIVRIVNENQPIGGRVKPYNDLWQGVLQLESINKGNLNF